MPYIAIDLKSFFASAEAVSRGLDPLRVNLVVADESRTEKTITLAVTPPLKSFGISSRSRLYEVIEKVNEENQRRLKRAKIKKFTKKSCDICTLNAHPDYEIDFIVAKPRMSLYVEKSEKIVSIYLKYVSADDLHIYSIDEVFIDVSPYMKTYRKNAREIAKMLVKDVFIQTGITATVGIGTNLFLAKIAMDIMAKKMKADADGVRIAELDEMTFRKKLWNHKPLSDFWGIGRRIAMRLENLGLRTMGDIAFQSVFSEDKLFNEFGVRAELLIDHAWGFESCTIKDIKNVKMDRKSISMGQVLSRPYTYDESLIILREMAEAIAEDLFEKKLLTSLLTLNVNYDVSNLENEEVSKNIEIARDYYNRLVPSPLCQSLRLEKHTNLPSVIVDGFLKIVRDGVKKELLIRRITVACSDLIRDSDKKIIFDESSLFDFVDERQIRRQKKEEKMQKVKLEMNRKFGKNSLIKAMSLQQCATQRERNNMTGGHKK